MIIGAGIAGLCTAIALYRKGVNVQLIETAPSDNDIVKGCGILVPPNAMLILEQYGIAQDVIAQGQAISTFSIRGHQGCPLVNTPAHYRYGCQKQGQKYHTIAIARHDLHQILLSHLSSDQRIIQRSCSHVDMSEGRCKVTFDDGSMHTTDFVIGADGIRSTVRDSLFPDSELLSTGEMCWRGVSTLSLADKWMRQLTEVWGGRIRFGFCPIEKDKVYWYALQHQTDQLLALDHRSADSIIDNVKEIFHAFPAPINDILSNTDTSRLVSHPIHELKTLSHWFQGGCVLVGDAAHAMTPNLGQGGAQAIEDSWVLAESLAREPDLNKAFSRYQALRYDRVKSMALLSRQTGKISSSKASAFAVKNVPHALLRFMSPLTGKLSEIQSRRLYAMDRYHIPL